MKGRFWLIAGALVGIAIAAGDIPYLAGASRSLAETTERLVHSGADRLIRHAASAGASRRVVLGLTSSIVVLLLGVTALLLVLAARGTLRVRALVGLLIVALAASSYVYHPKGVATGVLLLGLGVAAAAVSLSGPLVAAPLTALAALIGAEFLPRLVQSGRQGGGFTAQTVSDLHQAIFGQPGTPTEFQWVLVIAAAVPFAVAARLLLTR